MPIRSATYDPGSGVVTLNLARRINLHRVYVVTASGEGSQGITNTAGRPLNAKAGEATGGAYLAVVKAFWLSAR